MARSWEQIIAHADMDAFYAAVEQLDDPALRGKPLLVGPRSRHGVVLTASYEARPYRVGSAMPMVEALRRCPIAVVVPPRFERYEQVSRAIMGVFGDFSPVVEPLSLDEAFIDMTGSEELFGRPESMARKIRAAVAEVTGGLTASVGISGTKYVAKVASAHQKPDGLTVVQPEEAAAWLAPQSITRLWGAGAKTQVRLRELGLETIGDIAAAERSWLVDCLGSAGSHFHDLAYARDPRRVIVRCEAKSIGSECTLRSNVSRVSEIRPHLRASADKIGKRLRRKNLVASGVRVKLKTSEFRLLTRQCRLREPTDVSDTLYAVAVKLLAEFDDSGPFRLIGLAAYALAGGTGPLQLGLLDGNDRQRRLETTLDRIAERFGDDIVQRAEGMNRLSEPRFSSDIDFLEQPD